MSCGRLVSAQTAINNYKQLMLQESMYADMSVGPEEARRRLKSLIEELEIRLEALQ